MFDWIQENGNILYILAALSPLSLIIIAALAPLVIVRMPENYFTQRHRQKVVKPPHPVYRYSLLIFKNTLGSLFVVAGFLMVFIPGQGLLTMLIGLILMDFPGKYRIERWLVSNTGVLKPLNWLREKKGKPPLHL